MADTPAELTSRRQALIAIATIYLDTFPGTEKMKNVPFAKDCWRIENGRATAIGAEAFQRFNDPAQQETSTESERQVRAMYPPGPRTLRDVRWFVDLDTDTAIAFYIMDFPGHTAFIGERFLVSDGLIHEIEVIFRIRDEEGLCRWPEDPSAVGFIA